MIENCSYCNSTVESSDNEIKSMKDCFGDDYEPICDKCSIETLILSGWDLEDFEKYTPDFLKGELLDYANAVWLEIETEESINKTLFKLLDIEIN